jgi:hypothetical protein
MPYTDTTFSYRIASPWYICCCYACEVCLLEEYAIRHTLEKQLPKSPFLPSFRKYPYTQLMMVHDVVPYTHGPKVISSNAGLVLL